MLQSDVADLSACFDDGLFCRTVNEQVVKNKVMMEASSSTIANVMEDDNIFELFAVHVETPKGVMAQHLSKVWRILYEDAVKTIDVTSQLNNQSINASPSRRFSTNDHMLRYIDLLFYTDTFFSLKVVSKRGYSIMQLFVSDKGIVKVYGMKSQTEYINALKLFCKEVSAPRALIANPQQSQKSHAVK